MITAKDLLLKILDYKYLWSSPQRKDSLPAKARLAQIEVMLITFGVTKKKVPVLQQIKNLLPGSNTITDIDYFFRGDFINNRGDKLYRELDQIVRTTVISLFPDMADYIQQKHTHLVWLFNNLLLFMQEVYNLTYPNDGMLEGFSTGLHYSFYLQAKLTDIIKTNVTEIDDTLCLLIDPQKKKLQRKRNRVSSSRFGKD